MSGLEFLVGGMLALFIMATCMAFEEQDRNELKEQRNALPQQIMAEAKA